MLNLPFRKASKRAIWLALATLVAMVATDGVAYCKSAFDDIQRQIDRTVHGIGVPVAPTVAIDMSQVSGPTVDSYTQAIMQHNLAAYDQNLEVFRWQLMASNVMLWLVVAVVATGLLFSGYQIYRGTSSAKTTIKFGLHGAEISSSVVGILTLALAMGFVYLFMDKVYRIQTLPDSVKVELPEKHADVKPQP